MSILKKSSNDGDKSKKHVRFNLDTQSNEDDITKLTPLQRAHRRNILGTKAMFLFNYGLPLDLDSEIMQNTMTLKLNNSYNDVKDHPMTKQKKASSTKKDLKIREPPKKKQKMSNDHNNKLQQIKEQNLSSNQTDTIIESAMNNLSETSTQLVTYKHSSSAISTRNEPKIKKKKRLKAEWRRPWKLYKVISGHLGWVQSLCMDHSNEFFVSGSGDRTIKIWELATGTLRLTLTGHISNVRGLAISALSPYMFSCGEDKTVKCWDLEQNKVIRSYHGHLSGVYCLSLHPTLNILFTGGRDSSCRCWDIRTKAQIMVLEGHRHTVGSVATQQYEPQVITGSHDKTVRTWDLRNNGKTMSVLTNHKKSIRSVLIHPKQYTFLSGAADNIKIWKCPQSVFLRNMNEKSMNIVETMSINEDNVLMSGHQSGHLKFWDYKTGFKFQEMRLDPQPGSLDSESGILASTFDVTGTRLITGEADKTIKMFKEDQSATEESHPIKFSKYQNENTRF